jgi:hypothetical protein
MDSSNGTFSNTGRHYSQMLSRVILLSFGRKNAENLKLHETFYSFLDLEQNSSHLLIPSSLLCVFLKAIQVHDGFCMFPMGRDGPLRNSQS